LDKTEKATQHKREQERKKGNVFQSKDLITGVMILASFVSLRFLMTYMFGRFDTALNENIFLGATVHTITIPAGARLMFIIVSNLFMLALPVLLIAMGTGILMSVSQTRLLVATELLKPKFNRLNPIEGIKKMFSLKALVELLKSILKITIVIIIVYNTIMGKLGEMPSLMAADIIADIVWLGEAIFTVALNAGFGMLAIGIVDFFYQWWEHERSLRMSKQEVKDEYKQLEGNPETKSRIFKIQRQMSQSRMITGVKDADVVIRNPTHFAIALKYDIDNDIAPVVIAKGKDYLALRIIEEAAKNDVEIVTNPPLAQALYDNVDIYETIPEDFWEAVADIISYIYLEKKKDEKTLAYFRRR